MAEARRVALLARPGGACERMRAALNGVGAQLVLEADPTRSEPEAVAAAGAEVILVVLDAATEEALDRYANVLADPQIEVIFEEAEIAMAREGWDAARWVRHLDAKLHRHDDVLPPRREADVVPLVAAPMVETAVAEHEFEMEPAPVDHERIDHERIDHEPIAPAVTKFDIDFSDAGTGAETLTFDAISLEPPPLPPLPATGSRGDAGIGGLEFTTIELVEPERDVLKLSDGDVAEELSFTMSEIEPPPLPPLEPGDSRDDSDRFRRDLADLERRIASMGLVDDRPAPAASAPTQTRGAVLVLAGIGGPDAVRQLLGALPENFARPVLVQQRLDGGRYDRLVAQMQRATTLPVKLAEPGLRASAGEIYILPAELGISAEADGLVFTASPGDVLASLPTADSAVLLLSGADASVVDTVLNQSWSGALVAGQAVEGCYDAAATHALIARGGDAATPVELARRVTARWPS